MEILQYLLGSSALVAASAVGSFVACAIDRTVRAESFLWTRSRCRACNCALSARELVPIVSFLVQGGQCRSCGEPIPRELLIVELVAICPIALFLWLPPATAAAGVALSWLLLALASFDLSHGRLPDALTGALGGLGLLVGAVLDRDLMGAVLGSALGFGLLFLAGACYRLITGRDGLGGGDVKLLAGLGAWVAWPGLPWVLLAASASAIVFALVSGRRTLGAAMPFGPFLALAGIFVWCWRHSA